MKFSKLVTCVSIILYFGRSLCIPVLENSTRISQLKEETPSAPLHFPQFTYKLHPLFQDELYKSYAQNLKPVIMDRYYRHLSHLNARRNDEMLFAVGAATYSTNPPDKNSKRNPKNKNKQRNEKSAQYLLKNLDVLLVTGFSKNPKRSSKNRGGLEVYLTRPARVFVLLYGSSVKAKNFRAKSKISGIDKQQWQVSSARAVYLPEDVPNVVGDRSRVAKKFKLPDNGILIEMTGPADKIRLPHPSDIKVDSKKIKRYCLLFARDDDMKRIRRIPYPKPPKKAPLLGYDNDFVENLLQPVPNKLCPNWLHELWRVETRDKEVAENLGELVYWRTWHPPIDPVFWCYYDHEHGSFPGRHYPMFGYTAWKTPDERTEHGRQNESHEGFKIFSFGLEKYRKFVVLLVHLHLALPRRFEVRHHTVSIAILDELWNLKMELHMKMDFGAAVVTKKNKKDVPIDSHEQGIIDELKRKGRSAIRRFNLVNIDANYPASVDTKYLLASGKTPKKKNRKTIERGIYEKWSGPLNSCMKTRKGTNNGFMIDIRNPSTGIRKRTTSATVMMNGQEVDSLQELSGNSGNRMMLIRKGNKGLEIGIEHCNFDIFRSEAGINLERDAGVFYTDPYFEFVQNGSGRFSLRQFIRNDFELIRIPPGKILPLDAWPSGMGYAKDHDKSRNFMNAEYAVRGKSN